MKKLYTILFLTAFGISPLVNAQTTLFSDDFESGYTTATSLDGVNGWVVESGTVESVNDSGQGKNNSDWYVITSGSFTVISQTLAVEADQEYTFTIHFYKTGAGNVSLKVKSGSTDIAVLKSNGAADQWKQRTLKFTAPASENLTFQVIQQNTGIYKFDNIKITCTDCATASIDKFNSFDFMAYPNPIQDVLYIQSQETLVNAMVFDMLGRKVIDQNSNIESINMSNLNSGTYMLKLEAENGGFSTKKIIKK